MAQANPTADYWTRLQGIRLGGVHELREWIGDDGTHRYFAANRVDAFPHGGVIAVVTGGTQVLENQLKQWNIASSFDHPNLVRVYATGYDEVEERSLVYARMEQPEEDLGSVTLGRALTVDETTAVARALVSALRYMHEQGWVHSKVDPWSVVAIGSTIKLIIHEARPADPDLVAADIRAFGFTICQLLTKKADDGLISSRTLPSPFDAIVRGCTQRGWSLQQVERALDGLAAEVEIAAVPAAVVPPPAETLAPSPNRLVWISVAAAAGLLAAVLFLTMSRRPAATPPVPTTTAAPAGSTVLPTSTPAPVARQLAAAHEPADWRVIAYTYTARKDAEERARRINARWPQLRPEVFSPSGNAGPYLVAIGGMMTRSDAMRMRSKARATGLPRDTFARNFK